MSLTRTVTWASNPATTRGQVTQISSDAKGERIAYASNKSIFLRSIDDPTSVVQYTGHSAITTVARFSPSGYYVASADVSGKVRVWDAVSEESNLKGEFPIISGKIVDLAWDGESKRIIAVGDGREKYGQAFMFDSGNSVGEISGHSKVVNAVSIRPTRPYRAATGGDDGSIVFLHGPPFKFNSSAKDQHSNFVNGIAFSPDGAHLVSVGSDRKIFLWDGKTGELVTQIQDGDNGHKGSIFSVSWEKDSKRFVTASGDQTVKIWDVESRKNTHTWKFGDVASIPHQQVGVVWPNRADGLIISISNSGDLNYLSEKSKEPIRVIQGHQGSITSLKVEPTGKTLWTGSYEGQVLSWDVRTGAAEAPEGQAHSNKVVGFAQTKNHMYSAGMDDKIRMLDVGVKSFSGTALTTDGQPVGISTASSGNTVIVATTAEICIYTDGEKSSSLPIKFTPTALSFSLTTSILAVGATDNTIHIYIVSSSTIKPKSTLSNNRSLISALSFSKTSSLLAAGDSSGKIVLYDAESGEVKTTRWGFHTGRVSSIEWNEAGTHVVTGGLDTNIFVYSVETPGKNIKTMNAHKDGVNAVGWLDEGTVVSAGADACVKIWKLKF